ncbi:MAG: metallophosphoesterase [Pseudomonadota bacterium]
MSLLVISDIHGQRAAAEEALRLGDAEGRRIILLGDLVDRGPDSAGTLAMILPRVLAGEITWIRGNHDDKLGRALQGHNVQTTHGLAETLNEIARFPKSSQLKRDILLGLDRTHHWFRIGGYLFVHGAFVPDMLTWFDEQDAPSRKAWSHARSHALYGQTTGRKLPSGYPERIYNWVDQVPERLTVVVGHDVRDTGHPVTMTGNKGGRVIFLDTGAGKGGVLTAMRLDEETIEQFTCETRRTESSPIAQSRETV